MRGAEGHPSAEQALSESETRTRPVLDAAVDAIITIDERGLIESVNPATERLFGYGAAELIGENVKLLMPPPYREEHDGYLRHYLATGQKKIIGIGREVVGRRKDGSTFPMHLAVSEVRVGDRRLFTGIARDIAAVPADEAIFHLAAVVQSSEDAIISKNLNGVIRTWNAGAERLFGYRAAEVVGRPLALLVPPERADEEENILRRLRRGERIEHSETVRLRKDGTRVDVAVTVSPIRNAAGELVGASSIARDITERRRAEEQLRGYAAQLQQRNAELARSNQELDDFAYIASHDLKEPLRGIHNYATFLIEDYADKLGEDGRAKLETLRRLSQRMEALIDSLLQFSRVGRVDLAVQETDLNALLAEVLESLHISIQEQGVEVRVPRPLPRLRCDRVRTAEVFRNLLANAIKYNDKARKWVEVGWDESPTPVTLYVRDNGVGIPAKHFDAVFRIFKRLHGRDKFGGGTGAGLTIAKKIVERHGGRIWVESQVGERTTFYFTLAPEGGHR